MKLRFKAIMLALGLTVSAISMSVAAEEESETEQAVTEVVEETAAEAADTEEESVSAAEDETMSSDDAAEGETDLTEMESAEEVTYVESETETEEATMSAEEYYKELIANYLTQVDAWTDDQVDSYMESDDEVTALIAYNWNTVKSEVGDYVEVTEITGMQTTSDGYGGAITATAEYSGVSNGGTVTVTLEYEYVYSSTYSQYVMSLTNLTWDVDYTLGVMLQKAAMNTLMGVCIVFLMLAFLSFLISKIHYIPEAIEARSKKNEPSPAPKPAAPAPAPAAAPVVEAEVAPEDDLELIAVITAAIAAAREEDTTVNTGDAYVVRSIKKVNNRNWRRA
ncbi:MAG: OadG family protein [Lachnospiraceae bacterium]|nr:OadG family protein [Lachnospiraceae bacterium]